MATDTQLRDILSRCCSKTHNIIWEDNQLWIVKLLAPTLIFPHFTSRLCLYMTVELSFAVLPAQSPLTKNGLLNTRRVGRPGALRPIAPLNENIL